MSESAQSSFRIRVPTMDCAVEEGEIRSALAGLEGVAGVSFQLSERLVTVRGTSTGHRNAESAIRKAGFRTEVLPSAAEAGNDDLAEVSTGPRQLWKLGGALALAAAAELIDFLPDSSTVATVLQGALALGAIALAGLETYRKGFLALIHLRLNITALMSVAVTGALVIGEWPEAAMVMVLFAIAELIEARSLDRARGAIKGLMAMAPDHANVLQSDGSVRLTPTKEVGIGASIQLRPGERVPLDGQITAGRTAVDQSPVTGESIPVDRVEGDLVFAGTINQTAEVTLRVTALATDSALARIIHAVESAQASRAPTQRFVDRFSAVYTPAVFVLALVVAVVPPLLSYWTWLQAVYKALVLLVIACPCALVISTPVTVVSALAAGARRGLLIKGGAYLEAARSLRAVALDKTGTITEGKPRLVDVIVLAGDRPAAETVALGLAGRSDHPVSQAIAIGLKGRNIDVDAFTALPGRGAEGRVDGMRYVLGSHRLIKESGKNTTELDTILQQQESMGRTVSVLASEERAIALFAVADTLKATASDAIAQLKSLGISTVMLSGDNQTTAQFIAAQAGISDARGGLLPEDKLTTIRALRTQFGPIGMTGDGINDAPALAEADVGLAMGGIGTDIAMEAADVVIMNDDLHSLPLLIRLSRKTHRVLVQNIVTALGLKAIFLILAVVGIATMWMAVFADMGASLLVVANGLRMRRFEQLAPTQERR